MKSLALALFGSWCLLVGGTVWADESFFGTPRAAAVLQNPSGVTDSAKSAVTTLQPSVEELYDFHHSQWHTASSIALFSFPKTPAPIASLRAGSAISDFIPFGELQVDIPQLVNQVVVPHLPEVVKNSPSTGIVSTAIGMAGKYGHVGFFLGWNPEKSDTGKQEGLAVGVSLGARLTF